jgi:hypothetical protein
VVEDSSVAKEWLSISNKAWDIISWIISWITLLTSNSCLRVKSEALVYQLTLNIPHVLKAYDLEEVGIVQLDYERTA